jgi:hypothetical protein
MIQPFGEQVISALDQKVPDLLASIIIRNPKFALPRLAERSTVHLSIRIGESQNWKDNS